MTKSAIITGAVPALESHPEPASNSSPRAASHSAGIPLAAVAGVALAACGGGSDTQAPQQNLYAASSYASTDAANANAAMTQASDPATAQLSGSSTGSHADMAQTPVGTTYKESILSQTQAARFLAQATFGPTMSEIVQMTNNTPSSWINIQFGLPTSSSKAYIDQVQASLPAGGKIDHNNVFEAFWKSAVESRDQLRQRVKFALSQIFVVSLMDSGVGNKPRGVAAYYDMLGQHAFGNFRNLLEAVTLHPMMGVYLAMLRNQKEDGNRVPDQNYAREIMQLFTIGLYKLNQDGSQVLVGGKPVETYTQSDIVGLSRVFTGWSWYGADKTNYRFYGGNLDPDADWKPMQAYPQFHSTLEKRFLGVTIPASATSQAEADLKIALDTLFKHPNVAPFFCRQMIQHLVTSNPSPAYISRVAARFNDNGKGIRGDMKAVIMAILTDPEARKDTDATNPCQGRLREPILRLAQWMRASNAKSASSRFLIRNIDDPLTGLGQSPFRSPSVFNYYRPGYVPPGTTIASANLVAPAMQLTGEASVVGYLNTMRDVIVNGAGAANSSNVRDILPDYSAELALVDSPEKLLDRVALLLLGRNMSAKLRSQILTALNSVRLDNPPTAAQNRKHRVSIAIFLCMASPEYLVQK